MAMTLGKDVSALFPDVLKNIATSDLDQKKLVYLYLMLVFPFACLCNSSSQLHAMSVDQPPIGTMPNLIPTSAFSL
jgi:hypothetical protein